MKMRFLFLLFCYFLISSGVYAQISVSGRIVDTDGLEIPGVTVMVKGTTIGTVTDATGAYTLDRIPNESAVLQFSFVGYRAQEKVVGNQRVINLTMEEENLELDEVVVVGYGTSRKRDLTGAIQSVKLEDSPLATLPNINPMLALSGTVAGFDYVPQSGAGEDATRSMTIRGTNSIDKNDNGLNKPLIVVDGSIFYGNINEINMNDVASIDVLKDASAAAIYGSRSANGVILITTKTGKAGKPTINLNAYVGWQSWSRKPNLFGKNEEEKYLERRRMAYIATGDAPVGTSVGLNMLNTKEQEAYNAGQWTDWIDEITQHKPTQNYSVSISGSSDRASYYLSAGYLSQSGPLYNDDYKKKTFMGKVDTKITDWLTIGVKGNYFTGDEPGYRPFMNSATWLTPYSYKYIQTPGYTQWYDSNPGYGGANPFIGFWRSDLDTQPLGPAYSEIERKSENVSGNGWLQIDVPWIQGLRYKFTMSAVQNNWQQNMFAYPEQFVDTDQQDQMDDPSMWYQNSYGQAVADISTVWTLDQILTYANSFGKHNVDAMVGYTRDKNTYSRVNEFGKGFTTPPLLGWNGLHLATSQMVKKEQTQSQNVGYMVRLNYNYAYKYYITGNFRRDGFSGFAEGHKFGNFPGVSVGWAISEEEFMKSIGWLDYLKIRASYGVNGNQGIGPYATLSEVEYGWTVYGSTPEMAVYPSTLGNTSLTWAETKTMNFGLNFNVLKNRLSGVVDVYKSETINQLLERNLPYLTGYDDVRTNIGQVNNKGVEITLNSVNFQGDGKDKFRWESGVVFALNRNELVSLYGEGDDMDVSAASLSGGDALIKGKSIRSVYDLKMLGIMQKGDPRIAQYDGAQAGDVLFEDYGGPNKSGPDGKITADDRHWIGDRDPLFTMNINNTFSYKNFTLYIGLKWNAGNKTHYLGKDPFGSFHNPLAGMQNAARLKLDPWTEDNPSNDVPRLNYTNPYTYYFWQPRAFLKVKDITLSYNVDAKFLERFNIKGLNVYVSGKDLLTFTKWTGLDPESGGTIAAQPSSAYGWANPVYRTIAVGASITF